MNQRDEILCMDDENLAAICRLEFYKGSGPGGQHRNKTSSAVRVTLEQYNISASDCTERQQHRNRHNALKKLKILIALSQRQTPGDMSRIIDCSIHSPDYPLWTAMLFDILEANNYDQKSSALQCGISTTALLKKLARDPQLWREFAARRAARGLPTLKQP